MDQEACARRFRLTGELMEAGIAMRRARFRREFPDADEPEIERRLKAWMLEDRGEHPEPHFRRVDPARFR